MPIPLRIKICGVTTPEDVRLCADAGADAIGLNFHPASPRYLDPRKAQPIIRAISPFMSSVGVFVAIPPRQACAIAFQLGLQAVQWYGDPLNVADTFPFRFIPSFRVKDQETLAEIATFLEKCRNSDVSVSAILVDAFVEGAVGGTGHRAPWGLLADFNPGVPLILAGGLTPENVGEAIRIVRPAGVDVASGVEISPGKKDPRKIKAFIDQARDAALRAKV